ncbi:tetratricopeptide repeat protein [Streptomyces sp. NBC_00069]|uniref:tetratricopeptide repeat protein n=1 Tax=Streptomyces sp. NBC_00069 TaxID=2975639 RepID=UPI00324E1559
MPSVLAGENAALDTTTPHPDALLNPVAALPYPSHVLATLAVRLTSDLTQVQRDQTASEADLATSLSSLGIRLSEVGRWGEALEAELEAVEIRRRLADPVTGQPAAAHEPDLAHSLYVWAALLFWGQQISGALQATNEAVEIYRKLMSARPAQHLILSPLRAVLSLQAEILDGLGRFQEAKAIRVWLAANPEPPDSSK